MFILIYKFKIDNLDGIFMKLINENLETFKDFLNQSTIDYDISDIYAYANPSPIEIYGEYVKASKLKDKFEEERVIFVIIII